MNSLRKLANLTILIVLISGLFTAPAVFASENNSCSLVSQSGRTIVDFQDNRKIISSGNLADATSGPVSVSLLAGTYKVTLVSFDGYAARIGVSQPNERWFAILKSGASVIAQSAASTDLADMVDFTKKTEIVNNALTISQNIDSVTAFHAVYPDVSNANSVEPVCVAFDIVPACSDGVDNDGDGLTDYPNDLGCDNPTDNSENNQPIITIIGSNPMSVFLGSVFTNPGATANDAEDGNITTNIVNGGSVNTAALGSYTITYDVVDSQNLPAVQKTRVVNVVSVPVTPPTKQCSDGADNDGDTKIDTQDSGCHTDGNPNNPTTYDPNDDLENTPPIITVIGSNPFSGTVGDSYVDAGATALDVEDGNITLQIVTSGTIATTTTLSLGSFTITYSVTDSGGLSDQDSRPLTVQPKNNPPPPPLPPPSCTVNCGGGPSIPNLVITNEKVLKTGTTTAIVSWTTNLSATSRVLYESNSHATLLAGAPNYSYASSTNEDGTLMASHAMTIQGLDLSKAFYFRPISQTTGSSEILGIEVSLIPSIVQPPPLPPTLPPIIPSCEYLLEYLRIGQSNNPVEVRKLQVFLRDFEGFNNLVITEVFDQATFDAVSAFQRKYSADVLDPWSLPGSTGYVYYTTKKKVNEIYCAKAFPLTNAQLAEISQFKSVIEDLLKQGVPPAEIPGQGQVGLNQPTISRGTTVLASVSKPVVVGTSTIVQGSSAIVAVSSLAVPTAIEEFSSPGFSGENNFSNLFAALPENVFNFETTKQPTEETKDEKRGFATLVQAFSFADGILISSILLFLFGIWMIVARKREEREDERKFLGLDDRK